MAVLSFFFDYSHLRGSLVTELKVYKKKPGQVQLVIAFLGVGGYRVLGWLGY